MPVTVFDRLPLPSFRTYLAVSVALLAMSTYYAVNVTNDPSWSGSQSQGSNLLDQIARPKLTEKLFLADSSAAGLNKTNLSAKMSDVFGFMMQEPICTWTIVNMAYCCLALLGLFIQKLVFGNLRISEIQHVKEKFWNFIFYKFIFIFGVINVQYMEEVLLWCSWFSLLGFLQLLAQLCKDRFEYLSFSPTTPGWSHVKLLILLVVIQLVAGLMLLCCIGIGFYAGANTFAFMAAECVLLSIKTLHVIFRYGLHLHEMRAAVISPDPNSSGIFGSNEPSSWDKWAPFTYHVELIFEISGLLVDLAHHVHMLLWSNIFLSMASLVICMQLRYLFHEIQRRIRKHRNYLWVLQHMDRTYPMATAKEIAENSDNCAICWEKMESARKLPCTHLFHNTCLSRWMQQDTSCPTCRGPLPAWEGGPLPLHPHLGGGGEGGGGTAPQPPPPPHPAAPRRPHLNHFFHFDGSRYFSWLPSFSVEVTQMRSDDPATTSQLDVMARQVQQLFPHFPLSLLVQDLHITRSVELTVENILEGNLVIPNRFNHMDEHTAADSAQPSGSGHFVDTPLTQADLNQDLAVAMNFYPSEDIPDQIVEEPVVVGGRFSKSSSEREKILLRRKEQTVANARKKYLEKQAQKIKMENTNGAPSTSSQLS